MHYTSSLIDISHRSRLTDQIGTYDTFWLSKDSFYYSNDSKKWAFIKASNITSRLVSCLTFGCKRSGHRYVWWMAIQKVNSWLYVWWDQLDWAINKIGRWLTCDGMSWVTIHQESTEKTNSLLPLKSKHSLKYKSTTYHKLHSDH